MRFADRPFMAQVFEKHTGQSALEFMHREFTDMLEFYKNRDLMLKPEKIDSDIYHKSMGTYDRLVMVRTEMRWIENHRPYYDLYPAIIPMLANTSLEIDSDHIRLPINEVFIRCPEKGFELPSGVRLYSLFVTAYDDEMPHLSDYMDQNVARLDCDGFNIWPDFGMRSPAFADDETVMQCNTMRLGVDFLPGRTVEENLHGQRWRTDKVLMDMPSPDVFSGIQQDFTAECLDTIVKIVVGCVLLSQNPEFFVRQVLNRDKGKPITDKVLDRAKRRGKYGWSVGADIEVSPHFRRPHFSIRWKRINPAPAPLTPVLVPVKGCVVKRHSMAGMPTGYLDDSEGDDK